MGELKTGINLIGMLGCGKTPVGKLLAAKYRVPFVDTDDLITKQHRKTPGEIIAQDGVERFMAIQREVILAEPRIGAEIWATGGSVATDEVLVEHLGKRGLGVFLCVEPRLLEARTREERKAQIASDESFLETYKRRMPLYETAARIVIDIDDDKLTEELVADRVVYAVNIFAREPIG